MATAAASQAAALRWEVEDGVAVLVLDVPGRPVNVLSPELTREFERALERLARREDGVRAAVLLSGKPGVWIAGADIDLFRTLTRPEEAEALSRHAQELMNRLAALPVPLVAAIEGVALGGGLELALACSYRVAADTPKTRLGLPEVQLGLLPGAGGTQRLPRLIGVRSALDLMLTGRQLDPRRASKLGLVDEVVPASILRRIAVQRARELADGQRAPHLPRERGSPVAWERVPGAVALVLRQARAQVVRQTKGHYPAPLRILEVVGRTWNRPLAEGLREEARAFGALAVTPESRALVHIFFASNRAKEDPPLPPGVRAPTVQRMMVVGAGFMGAGIAAVSAQNGIRVRLKDVNAEALGRGLRTARQLLETYAQRRRLPRWERTKLFDRLQPTLRYNGLRHAELVVEAVFEDVELKRHVFRELEAAAAPTTVLASNTSTIPIARLAEAVQRPERVIGLHFFSPVERMPLVEVIVPSTAAPAAVALGHRYVKAIGKTPIRVADRPGFYVNRILGPYVQEALLLLESGVPIEAIDAAAVAWGLPVGPITLLDEVGLDVAQKSGEILRQAFGDRGAASDALARLMADGRLGRKNGRGFFRYEAGKRRGVDAEVYRLLGVQPGAAPPTPELQDRLVLPLLNEAVRALEEGVIDSPDVGDIGAVFGFGFPPFRGGPFWHLDQLGLSTVVARLEELTRRFGRRFEPTALLRAKAERGERFYA